MLLSKGALRIMTLLALMMPHISNAETTRPSSPITEYHDADQDRVSDEEIEEEKTKWTLEPVKGRTYLKAYKSSERATGKSLFICSDEHLLLYAIYYAGENAQDIINETKYFYLVIDDSMHELKKPMRFKNVDGWVNAVHELDADLRDEIAQATIFIYAMTLTERSTMYRGFDFAIESPSDREIVKKHILKSCN